MTNFILQTKNLLRTKSKNNILKSLSLLVLVMILGVNGVKGQQSITVNTAVTQDFSSMSSTATATLPTGFRIGTDWSSGTTATTLAYGTTGTGAVTGTSSGGAINWANGITGSATDRSLGFLSTNTYTSPRSIIYAFTNNTGATITSINLSWNYEKSRSGSRAFDWTFFHGSTSTAATAATAGNQSYSADANNTVISNPPSSTSKSFTISSLSIANGTTYYLRWTYTGNGGSSNAQGLSIDDFSITLPASTTAPLAPTLGAITSGNQQLSVAFTAGSDGGAAITNYEYSTNGGSSFTACSPSQTTSPIVITGLTNGTSYNVQIRAVNSVGSGTATASTAATPYTNPAAPTINSITPGNTQLSVAFTAGNNGGSTITNYKYSTNGGSSFTACSPSQTTSPIVITGLTNGTSYDVKILAVNIAGDGTASATTTATPVAPVSPTISASGSLSALSTTYGTPSSTTSFTVSGATLADDILITPPAGYEISKTSNTTGFAATQTLTQSGGIVNSTTIYVRLAATTLVGASYSGDIVLSSSGVSPSATIATSTSTVSTATLTISGLTGDNKNYDGGTSASVSGTASFVGLQNGETFSVATTPTYTFASKNIGTGITINQSVPFAAPSSNYTVTQPTLTANIAAVNLTITGATVTSKNYDRLTTAVITGGTLNGIIGSETVNATSGTFIDKNVGTSKAVTILLTGADAGNYTLTQPNITGDINAIALTITSPAVTSKAFDGTTAATITGTLSGIISPDVVTLVGTGVFASSAQANGISVTSTSTLAGADAGNYTLTQPTGLTGNITASILAGWNFFGQSSPSTVTATTFNSNLVSTSSANNITRGSGAASSSGSNSFRTVGFQNNGIATSNTDYFQITLTAASGYATSLSSIDAKVVGTASYCVSPGVSQQFAYSLDGTNFTLIGSAQSTIGTPGTLTQIDLSGISALQNVAAGTTITIRYYASGQTNTGGWGFNSPSAAASDNGLSIGGLVSAIPTNNWIGGSSNWNTGSNWSLSRVPLTTDNITISSGSPIMDVNYTLATGRTLTISGTGTLTINPTRILTIAGTADFGGKLVTVKSDATGTGAIGQISGTLTNATNVNVERYIPASASKKYKFLSSAVSTTVEDWRNEIFITGGGASNEFTQVGTNNIKSNGLDWTLSGSSSMYGYTENLNSGSLNSKWVAMTNSSNSITLGKGYRTFIRGDRSQAGVLDNSIAAQSEVTITSVGTINQGSTTLPTTYNGAGNDNGWNLVGNPYPSSIDWNATTGWTKTNVSGSIYIYNPTSNSYGSFDGTTSTNGVTRYISSGQGFFVRTTGASPILSCTESVKSVNAGADLFKTENENMLRIKLIKNIDNYDETVIRFYEGKQNEFSETDDVRKLMNPTINIYSYLGDSQNVAINYLNPSNLKNSVVKLSAMVNETGTYKLDFSGINSFSSTPYITLKDNYLNTKTDLKAKETYSFDVTSDVNTNKDGRFEISFTEYPTSTYENFSNEFSINTYPNPVNDILNINISNSEQKNYTFVIYNTAGAEIFKGKLTNNINQLNIENLDNGIYILKISSQSGINKSIKFIK